MHRLRKNGLDRDFGDRYFPAPHLPGTHPRAAIWLVFDGHSVEQAESRR
jgi:hypothetical protein